MIYIKTKDAAATLAKLGAKLSKKELAKAQSRAINRSLEKGRTQARKLVKEVYNIPQKNLTGVNYHRSTQYTLKGDIYASTKPIPIDAFSPKQETANRSISISRKGVQKVRDFKRSKKSPTAGVSIEVIKGKREVIPFAFMIPGGKPRVFGRGAYKMGSGKGFVQRHHRINKDGNDTPVKPLITLSVFGSVINKKVMAGLKKDVKANYPARLEHEILTIFNGWERPRSL